MDNSDLLKQLINSADEEKINEIIPRSALRLDEGIIKTVDFIFWLSYMTEKDLDSVLTEAWKATKQYGSSGNPSLDNKTFDYIKNKYRIKLEKIDPDSPNYSPIDVTFGDRIKIFEDIFGDCDHLKFLKEIKGLRNNISHLRVYELKYSNEDLSLISTKKKLLIDYFETMTNKELPDGKIWNELTNEEKEEVLKRFGLWKKDKQI